MKPWASTKSAGCEQRLLVRSDVGTVTECSCGKLHLKLGYLSLHFDISGMTALGRLLEEAVQKRSRRQQKAEGDLRLLLGDIRSVNDDPERLD